ncbi:MAG: T9SS type A sorting domain-containing protein, partial [Bacteroidales bacterium]|nr:T9SS type A sorting domain-containing protein [Bacteroidales bacterium]
NPYYVDIIGHWIGGHEPGNFGLFHMALERGEVSTIDPANIPVYEWDAADGATMKTLDEFERHTLKTNYLRKDYDGGNEDYWHLVNEDFDYSSVSGAISKVSPLPFNLGGNFPNPFSDNTNIPFQIQKAGHVYIEVINEVGKTVEILENRPLVPGNHMITWNSSNHPAGLYLCRMQFGGMLKSGKMLLIR